MKPKTIAQQAELKINISFLDSFFFRLVPFGFSGVILIGQGDKILLNKGYGHRKYEANLLMEADTVLSIGSISKQFTSTMIMQLVDQNKLSIKDTLGQFFKEISVEFRNITLHQLMTHTSGLKEPPIDDFTFVPTQEFLKMVWKEGLNFEPGSKYNYSNTGYSILGIIIEIVTGKKYQDYFLDNVLKTIGIKEASWFGDPQWNDNNSTNYYLNGTNTGSIATWEGSWKNPYWGILANGGVCITTKGLFTWLREVFSKKFLSSNSLKLLITPALNDYAYGWNVTDTILGTFISHNGGNDIGVNSICNYYKDHDLCILIFSNVVNNGFGYAMKLGSKLEDLLLGKLTQLPPKILNLFSPQIKDGMYSASSGEFELQKHPWNFYSFIPRSQNITNFLFNSDEQAFGIYENMNRIVDKFAEAMYMRDWEKAFQFTETKTGYEQRVTRLEALRSKFEKQYGELKELKSTITIPFPPYLAVTHMAWIGENGSSGIPIIWGNDKEILGFRPMESNSVVDIPMVQTSSTELIAYDVINNISFKIEIDNNENATLELI